MCTHSISCFKDDDDAVCIQNGILLRTATRFQGGPGVSCSLPPYPISFFFDSIFMSFLNYKKHFYSYTARISTLTIL